MEKKHIIFEEATESLFNNYFVKDGCFIPQYDEDGADNGVVISAKCDDPKSIVCPYCGGADNILEKENINERPILSENLDGGDLFETTLDGFRCASCFRKWVMFNFNKCEAVAIGCKSEIARGQAS
jgi:hypothetical protein